MKIYFAGSIRGGRTDVDVYLKIINHLKKYGEVLSEHIGDKRITDLGEEIDEKHIYNRDLNWIKEADIIIAEVSTPSLGVGYEIAKAEDLGKEVLCVYKKLDDGKKISAMIIGNNKLNLKDYSSSEELLEIIDTFMQNRF